MKRLPAPANGQGLGLMLTRSGSSQSIIQPSSRATTGLKVVTPWRSIPDWKLKDPKGFDLALWYGYELCGLCYATPRRSRLTIKIILLEGKPGAGHALKGLVAPLTLMAIDLYARLMNFREIEIQHPEPTAIRYYKVLGFRLDKAGRLVISVGDS